MYFDFTSSFFGLFLKFFHFVQGINKNFKVCKIFFCFFLSMKTHSFLHGYNDFQIPQKKKFSMFWLKPYMCLAYRSHGCV